MITSASKLVLNSPKASAQDDLEATLVLIPFSLGTSITSGFKIQYTSFAKILPDLKCIISSCNF